MFVRFSEPSVETKNIQRVKCCGHTAIFLLHKLSKASKWLSNLAHNLIFEYDCTFAAQNFYSINTSRSFVFEGNSAEFYAQFYSRRILLIETRTVQKVKFNTVW